MEDARLDLRLDSERHGKLRKIAESRGVTVSYAVRELIDTAIEESELEERLKAVEEIGKLNIENVPDPDELSRQLNSTHDLPNLY